MLFSCLALGGLWFGASDQKAVVLTLFYIAVVLVVGVDRLQLAEDRAWHRGVFYCSLPCCLRQGLSVNWNLDLSLRQDPKLPGTLCVCPTNAGLTDIFSHVCTVLCGCWGFELRSAGLHSMCSCLLSHFPTAPHSAYTLSSKMLHTPVHLSLSFSTPSSAICKHCCI